MRFIEREAIDRCGRDCPIASGPGALIGEGLNLVRVHDTKLTEACTVEGDLLWVSVKRAPWLRSLHSRCVL
jgi:hypothetical protein